MVQQAITNIQNWSLSKKLQLNPNKCEVAAFSNGSADAQWQPTILLNGQILRFNPTPKFLGVTLDRSLTFRAQVNEVANRASRRCRMLAAVAGKDWGWRAVYLRRLYDSTIRSVIRYCGPAWQPWLSTTRADELQRTQNRALRIITGQHSSTPIEALHLETTLPTINIVIKRDAAIALERSLRLPPNNPRRQLAECVVPHRSKARSSWRKSASETVSSLNVDISSSRVEFAAPTSASWYNSLRSWQVIISDAARDSRYLPEEDRATLCRESFILHSAESRYIVFTDGAVTQERHGGSAAVIQISDTPDPVIITSTSRPPTTSYDTEVQAILLAVNWLNACSDVDGATICCDNTDVLNSVRRLTPPNSSIAELQARLSTTSRSITLLWVPSGSPGNDKADEAAKRAATESEAEPSGISFHSAKKLIEQQLKDPPIQHPRLQATYSQRKSFHAATRADETLLAQLRSGHCIHLAAYKSVTNSDADPTCDRCHGAPETVEHWLCDCPGTADIRSNIFGTASPPLSTLGSDPQGVLSLARHTFSMTRRQ
jgi:ribonuclease HI